MSAPHDTTPTADEPVYAIVEMKGHARFGARLTTTTLLGIRGAHAEVLSDDKTVAKKIVPPSSVHTLTLCTEEQARRVAPTPEAIPAELGEQAPGGLPWTLLGFASNLSDLAEKHPAERLTPAVLLADAAAYVEAMRVALARGDEDAVGEAAPELAALAFLLHSACASVPF